MDVVSEELEKLSRNGSLSKSLEDVQQTIDLLVKARDTIAVGLSISTQALIHFQT